MQDTLRKDSYDDWFEKKGVLEVGNVSFELFTPLECLPFECLGTFGVEHYDLPSPSYTGV